MPASDTRTRDVSCADDRQLQETSGNLRSEACVHRYSFPWVTLATMDSAVDGLRPARRSQMADSSAASGPGLIPVVDVPLHDLLSRGDVGWVVQARQPDVAAMWASLSSGQLDQHSRILVFSDSLVDAEGDDELVQTARAVVAMANAGAHVFVASNDAARTSRLTDLIGQAAARPERGRQQPEVPLAPGRPWRPGRPRRHAHGARAGGVLPGRLPGCGRHRPRRRRASRSTPSSGALPTADLPASRADSRPGRAEIEAIETVERSTRSRRSNPSRSHPPSSLRLPLLWLLPSASRGVPPEIGRRFRLSAVPHPQRPRPTASTRPPRRWSCCRGPSCPARSPSP